MKVWIDGRIVDGAEARIPVTDHGFLYGDGVFEGIRVYARRVFRLEQHLARLAVSARAVGLEIPGGLDGAREIILATARAFGADESYVRFVVSRGEGALGVDPTSCPRPRVVCIVDHIRIYPSEVLARGIDLVTSSWRRPPPDVLDPRV
jgi:branched-chain amino acid aminotransferase